LADGKCGGIDAQLEVEVKFGNKQVFVPKGTQHDHTKQIKQ